MPKQNFAGAHNLRELGGLAGAGGKRIRYGMLFRSERLSHLTDADVEALGRLGLRTVVDLRYDHERELFPSRLPAARPKVLEFDVLTMSRDNPSKLLFQAEPSLDEARAAMVDTYSSFPTKFAPILGAVFDRLIDGEGAPLLFHCMAGKDRTGFLSAMLLAALGAEVDVIEADYMATQDHADRSVLYEATSSMLERHTGQRVASDVINLICDVEPEYLRASFSVLDRDWGGATAYLAEVAALDPPRLDRLRSMLLDP